MTTNILILPSNPNSFDVKVEIYDNGAEVPYVHEVKGEAHLMTYVTTSRKIVITETPKAK